MERRVLQDQVGKAVAAKLAELKVSVEGDHARRLIRVLVRMAARVALDQGCPPPIFLGLVVGALNDELQASEPALVPKIKVIDGALN